MKKYMIDKLIEREEKEALIAQLKIKNTVLDLTIEEVEKSAKKLNVLKKKLKQIERFLSNKSEDEILLNGNFYLVFLERKDIKEEIQELELMISEAEILIENLQTEIKELDPDTYYTSMGIKYSYKAAEDTVEQTQYKVEQLASVYNVADYAEIYGISIEGAKGIILKEYLELQEQPGYSKVKSYK